MMRSTAESEGLTHVWERAKRLVCPTCRAGRSQSCRKGLSQYDACVIHKARWRAAEAVQRLIERRAG